MGEALPRRMKADALEQSSRRWGAGLFFTFPPVLALPQLQAPQVPEPFRQTPVGVLSPRMPTTQSGPWEPTELAWTAHRPGRPCPAFFPQSPARGQCVIDYSFSPWQHRRPGLRDREIAVSFAEGEVWLDSSTSAFSF